MSTISKLTEKNYRSWAAVLRAILRDEGLFDVVDGQVTAPAKPTATASTEERAEYDAAFKAYDKKARRACRILICAISYRMITYAGVEDEDDPAKIWSTLRDQLYNPYYNGPE